MDGVEQDFVEGSIPAWAGETGFRRARMWTSQVYPRVGGGNFSRLAVRQAVWGLSPRGRGKRPQSNELGGRLGSIPAWAGETNRFGTKVYPRVGGGNSPSFMISFIISGLSPRGRGKHSRRA